ncbi:MAG: YCII-related protein [Bacteroidota bacterium]|nr:YCII-related protein [Bacteroidota bacterium]
MKNLYLLLCCLSVIATVNAQIQPPVYDSLLAKKLNADDYGMKNYVFVLLKTGSNTSTDKTAKDKAFEGHMKNIQKMADNGKLAVAGPFSKGGNNRGIFILNVSSFEEAKKLLEGDPAVKENYLETEMTLWYGSAALMETPEIHKKLQKKDF